MQTLETRHLKIDFLYVDIESCRRCKGTDSNLATAIKMAQALIDGAGHDVTVQKTLVSSAEMAAELGFISSPTIRVNGIDVDVDLRESRCEDCTEVCGCGEDITCRVWRYKGQDYEIAPVPVLLDAIMSAVHTSPVTRLDAPQALATTSENLSKFFAAKEEKKNVCCGPEKAATCCGPQDKSACCGAPAPEALPTTCGC